MDVFFYFFLHTEFSQILDFCSYIIHPYVSNVLCCTGEATRKEMQVSVIFPRLVLGNLIGKLII
jgi:hypothetical protein